MKSICEIIVLVIIMFLTINNLFSQDDYNKNLFPDDSLFFSISELDTILVLWNQPGDEGDLSYYNLVFTEIDSFVKGDTVEILPKYTYRIDNWEYYNEEYEKSNILYSPVNFGKYMLQLIACDTSDNCSSPSNPVWLKKEKSEYYNMPTNFKIIMLKGK